MPRILFVKTSSLGDVVHNCPAVSDVARHLPGAAIDWVVEEAFAEVAAMHAHVRRVIPMAVRRWRGALLASSTWREVGALRTILGSERYDAVIDSQGLLKSALVAVQALGRKHGFDRASARESVAACFYDVRYAVQGDLHAVDRNRRLAAAALGYRIDGPCDYGLRVTEEAAMQAFASAYAPAHAKYALLLTMTSRDDKLWPEEHWRSLGIALQGRGIQCVLPWGTENERRRCARIATATQGATVPRRMTLTEIAQLARAAHCVVGVDTGLAHLAAALGVPVVGLYCNSDPALTGLHGAAKLWNLGKAGQPPAVRDVLEAVATLR